uniref:Ketoreductase CTB6 ) n=1 Tax=Ganoderma boninense TaxID=34458 RepID=A0A5K1JVG1_9APHY|nr:Ketoreductase CTB6 (EC (Cercosporin toxin biosynthesis cluster protein 6) [Ganoderma boninense]
MPAISASGKILITGANGFIGHWLIRLLLEGGYSVRAAVRSADKGEAILKTFSIKLPERSKDVEYVVVPDFATENAYDDAVRGVGGIVHIASTVSRPVPDPQMIIRPAVDATVGLLRSAVAHG